MCFFTKDPEPAGFVVRQGVGMVERTRVDPDPCRSHVPASTDRFGEQMTSQPQAEEAGKEAEERDLDVAVLEFQLEITRGRPFDVSDPGLEFVALDPFAPVFFCPD